MPHVFLSYVREDHHAVRRMAHELKQAGIDVWLDREQIRPGALWADAIREAIEAGAMFVACFSRAYGERDHSYMDEELAIATEVLGRRSADRKWFIPVLLAGGRIPDKRIGERGSLSDIQWISLDEDWQEGMNGLVDMVLGQIMPDEVGSDSEKRERQRLWKRADRMAAQLADLLSSTEDRRHAAAALEPLCARTMRPLAELEGALMDEDETVRSTSMRCLVAMGSNAAEALVRAIESPHPPIRDAALEGLRAMGPDASGVIAPLIEALRIIPEETEPLAVSHVLGAIGEAAVPALLDAMEGRDPAVVPGAARALCRMAPPAAPSVPRAKGWLGDADETLRAAAISVVVHQIENSEEVDWGDVVVPLAEALRTHRTSHAFRAFMKLGPAASAAIPTLIQVLREPVDDPIRFGNSHDLAEKALSYIGPASVPALMELIRHRQEPGEHPEAWFANLKARYDGLWALERILWNHDHQEGVTFLQKLAAEPREHIWLRAKAAAFVSGQVGQSPALMAVLANAIWPSRTRWDQVSRDAIQALAEYRDHAEEISKTLVKLLRSDASVYVKEAAVEALGEIGAPIDLVKPVLEEIGGDGESGLRGAAQKVLERLAGGDGQGSTDSSNRATPA